MIAVKMKADASHKISGIKSQLLVIVVEGSYE